MRHRRRLDGAVSHVLDSLDNTISLQETAAMSFYSPVHFQALFTEYLGETFYEFVLRNRLFLAAKRLVSTYEKLNDLAFISGFSSQANFTRAFKQWFGVAPAKFRNEFYGQRISPAIRTKPKRRATVSPTLDIVPERLLLSSLAQGYMSSQYEHTLWDATLQLCEKLRALGVTSAATRAPTYVARDVMDLTELALGLKMAAVEVDAQTAQRCKAEDIYRVPAGLYATFTHQGILPEQTLNIGLFDWLPTSQYQPDWRRPVLMCSEQVSLSQFCPNAPKRQLNRGDCLLVDGLGFSLREVAQTQIRISIPVASSQEPLSRPLESCSMTKLGQI
ncbi:hypothetical protein GCM10008090_17530 [Arenicella chitinivorans]|uniref:HTH araC/xylS-type domain-containing protein n=2 Tax=Arenicella chitinivorans TaxID=1329800 RepID=A0A918RSY9_9GAMM|nr:hypothetical protein GCM10008090_17530 [Arenicella chitinivorans]